MAKVEGLNAVLKALGKRLDDARREGSPGVRVSFSAAYAVWVHERRDLRHKTGKAGFLLDPARRLAPELGAMVGDGLKKGLTLSQSLLRAGLRLQREAQAECPVEFGALRASAATTLEPG
jgi:hypothetical protein